jgi:hypothetical protein
MFNPTHESSKRWRDTNNFSPSSLRSSSLRSPSVGSSHQMCREASLLTTLPSKDTWIKRGIVERRTVHANVIWRERQMILTKDSIYFARVDSDLVVDKILISDIVSIGKVDHSANVSSEDLSNKAVKPGRGKNVDEQPSKSSKRRRSSVLANISRSDTLESFQDGFRETFSFEIKTCSGEFYRSYFVRVTAQFDCDSWIEEVNTRLKSTLREHANNDSWLEKKQRNAREIHSNHSVRCIIAFAMLLDFLSCVFNSEFLPAFNTTLYSFFMSVDIILCIFFSLELILNMFGNWRNMFGSPFLSSFSNWFQIATVLFQLIAFSDPRLESFKVIRIIRIFDVGSAFRSLASCQMILKAIRQGKSQLHPFESKNQLLSSIVGLYITGRATTARRDSHRPTAPSPCFLLLIGLCAAALVPVSSALIILLFVMSIFAVISVHLFGYDLVNFGNFMALPNFPFPTFLSSPLPSPLSYALTVVVMKPSSPHKL